MDPISESTVLATAGLGNGEVVEKSVLCSNAGTVEGLGTTGGVRAGMLVLDFDVILGKISSEGILSPK